MRIDHIEARSILDTRGLQTVETTLTMQQGSTLNPNSKGRTLLHATASVPSGKSTGTHESVELRDADGSVTRAIENVNGEIANAIIGHDFRSLDDLDDFLIELDGTPNKSRLGANAILSVSISAMRLSAIHDEIPLWKAIAKRAGTTPSAPRLYVNVMNGGVHAQTPTLASREARPEWTMPKLVSGHADFKLPFQEYILVVDGDTSAALQIAHEIFAKLGEKLGAGTPMGDEGGYAPTFDTIEHPFELLTSLVENYKGTSIAIDSAASELFHDGAYDILGEHYSADELTSIYERIAERFPIHSIEDPFDENSSDDFVRLTSMLIKRGILIVGDDFTCTNPKIINEAIQKKAINAVLIKPNQIGTVREAIVAVQNTYSAGFKTIASHRSGETDDTFIADFAYGIGAHGIKAGGLGQKERLEKYDRLLAIEREAEAV